MAKLREDEVYPVVLGESLAYVEEVKSRMGHVTAKS